MRKYSFLLACVFAFFAAMAGSLWYLNTREERGIQEQAQPRPQLNASSVESKPPKDTVNLPSSSQPTKPGKNIIAAPQTEQEPIPKVEIKHPPQEVLPKQKTREEELRDLKAQIQPKETPKDEVVSIPVADDLIEKGKKIKQSIEDEAKDAMQDAIDVLPGVDAEIADADLGVSGSKVSLNFTIPADRIKLLGKLPPDPEKTKKSSEEVVSDDIISCDISSKDRK